MGVYWRVFKSTAGKDKMVIFFCPTIIVIVIVVHAVLVQCMVRRFASDDSRNCIVVVVD